MQSNTASTTRRGQDKQRYKDTPYRAWYGWAIWHRIKQVFFASDDGDHVLCEYRDPRTGVRCNQPSTEVDHIKPHKGVWSLFVDLNNLQGLCHVHHSQKTAREETSP